MKLKDYWRPTADVDQWLQGRLCTYFAQCIDGGPIKIGKSTNPLIRLRGLQVGCPYPLVFRAIRPGEHDDAWEAHYHTAFAEFRLHGEWFEPCEPIRREIQRLRLHYRHLNPYLHELEEHTLSGIKREYVDRSCVSAAEDTRAIKWPLVNDRPASCAAP